MKFNLFKQEEITAKDLVNEGFYEIIDSVYLGQNEIAIDMGMSYKKFPLEKLNACRIERRVRHYNLHIEGENLNYNTSATLLEVQQAASKISDAASKKGHIVPVKIGCMKVNLMEAFQLAGWDACDGCIGILIWPIFAIVYYTILPLANIILRIFIK